MASFLRPAADGVQIFIRLQPRSSRNAIGEISGNELKVHVTAPPVDSAANQALVEFLAGRLGCARGAIQLVRGRASRHKTLLIRGLAADVVEAALAPAP